VIHCSSGRDRTGVLAAAWLVYSLFASSADDAAAWFAARRVGRRARPAQAIAGAGQRRYVRYVEATARAGGYHTKRVLLTSVGVVTCPRMDDAGGCALWVAVLEEGREVFSSLSDGAAAGGGGGGAPVRMEAGAARADFPAGVLVAGDVRVRVYNRDAGSGRDELCCFVCFHTGFVDGPAALFDKSQARARPGPGRAPGGRSGGGGGGGGGGGLGRRGGGGDVSREGRDGVDG
jgi:hypothetical protein